MEQNMNSWNQEQKQGTFNDAITGAGLDTQDDNLMLHLTDTSQVPTPVKSNPMPQQENEFSVQPGIDQQSPQTQKQCAYDQFDWSTLNQPIIP